MVGVIIYFFILYMLAAEAQVLISYTWAKVLKLKKSMIGVWKYHAGLVRLVHFHSEQV